MTGVQTCALPIWIAAGELVSEACAEFGVTRLALVGWAEKYPDFGALYARAREAQADACFEFALKAGRIATPADQGRISMRLLVAFDGSEGARAALREAASLARETGASVVLLQVLNPLLDASDIAAPTTEAAMVTATARAKATLEAADRKSTRLNSSHIPLSRMPSSA